jgi:hypothetical protein
MSDSGNQQSPSDNQSADSFRPLPVLEPMEDKQLPHADHLSHTLAFLSDRIEKIAVSMEKSHLQDYVQLALHPWKLIWRNLIYGTARGVGIAIGFTFFAATIVWMLQILGKLNLPIVGDYIADIVRIVQRQLQIKPF